MHLVLLQSSNIGMKFLEDIMFHSRHENYYSELIISSNLVKI